MRTARLYAAVLAVAAAFGALFLVLAPSASAMTASVDGRYPAAPALRDSSNLGWVTHAVGTGTDLSPEAVQALVILRDSGCEALHARVPAARIVAVYARELGSRRDAVTLFTAMSVWCGTA